MHPAMIATRQPEQPAVIQAESGAVLSYAELDRRSNQGAQVLRSLGLRRGGSVALMLDNSPQYFELLWAAQRSGLRYTAISTQLTASETSHIVRDCGASLLIADPGYAPIATRVAAQVPTVRILPAREAGGAADSFERRARAMPVTPIGDESPGIDLLYSSGTTGRPKGVSLPLPDGPISHPDRTAVLMQRVLNIGADSRYLSPAPLYHAAALRFGMGVQRIGGTVVLMQKFDAAGALAAIERYRCDSAQFVPTHFVRMLRLPERERFDPGSLRMAVHSAAPCPIAVKEAMFDWWGPVLHEYYSGTEGIGICHIGPADWLAHRGSVGRALVGEVHVCDPEGEPLPPRTPGLIYFANGPSFEYHHDAAGTAAIRNRPGWLTLGDIGWLDEDGYLYLTDRQSFTIISGGVNIYPQEIEQLFALHPKVADIAVVGIPDEDLGERVVAVIEPRSAAEAGPALARELLEFAGQHLARLKLPRAIEFVDALPRQPNGKLYKQLIKERWIRHHQVQ